MRMTLFTILFLTGIIAISTISSSYEETLDESIDRLSHEEKDCKMKVRQNESYSHMEKNYYEKLCQTSTRTQITSAWLAEQPRHHGKYNGEEIQLLQHIQDCGGFYPMYSLITSGQNSSSYGSENTFLGMFPTSGVLMRQCVIMYNLDCWDTTDSDRTTKLMEGLSKVYEKELEDGAVIRAENTHNAVEAYKSV